MASFLSGSQIILAILLIIVILLQQRGTSLGGAFGGEGVSFRSRRGMERTLMRLTVVLATFFLLSSIARLFL